MTSKTKAELVKETKEALAAKGVTATEEYPEIADVLPKPEFYPDMDRIKFNDILNEKVLISDAQIIENFQSGDYDPRDAALILIMRAEHGDFYTTISSGEVIVKKLRSLLAGEKFPVWGTFVKTNKGYYDII